MIDERKPNILLIMTDEEPITAIGCYGNNIVKTPMRDSLARDGIMFSNHYCASYPCTPSRASIITGRYSHNHGLITNETMLDEKIPTLANILESNGYDTAWIGKSHMGGSIYRRNPEDDKVFVRIPDENGYSYELRKGGVGEDGSVGGFRHWIGGWRDYQRYLKDNQVEIPTGIDINKVGGHTIASISDENGHSYSGISEKHHIEHFLADQTISYLESMKDKTSPFCCVLSFYGPHSPVSPPEPWDEMYSIDEIELPLNFDAPMGSKPKAQYMNARKYLRDTWTKAQFKDYIRRYYGFVSYIDEQIGRVLKSLEDNGLEHDTIVVFTSDHGDMVGQFGMQLKMINCGYDVLMKTPLIIKWPGRISGGRVAGTLASNIDILPTLLELADVKIPAGIDGLSMVKTLGDTREKVRDKVFISVMARGYVVRKGDWKYVLNCGADATINELRNRQKDELYYMTEDMWETRNLAYDQEYAGIVKELREEIFNWLKETGFPYVDILKRNSEFPAT